VKMRSNLKVIDENLQVHIEYDFLTIGELGNILIRLQAALRSLAELSPRDYNPRYSYAQPRFITTSIDTGNSVDINLSLAVLSIVMSSPSAMRDWQSFAREIYRRLKMAIFAIAEGEIQHTKREDIGDNERSAREDVQRIRDEGINVNVRRGNIQINASEESLNELNSREVEALLNLLISFRRSANKVVISDKDSSISIE